MKKINLLLVLLLSILLFNCGGDKKKDSDKEEVKEVVDANAISITDAEMETGAAIYFDKCAGCHGSSRLLLLFPFQHP